MQLRRSVSKMETQNFTTALLYIGIFAGIPLAVIGVLFSLILKVVDPDAMMILIIFTAMFVAMWIFVPRERPERQRRAAETRERTVGRSVPSTKVPDAQPQVRRKAQSKARKKKKKR